MVRLKENIKLSTNKIYEIKQDIHHYNIKTISEQLIDVKMLYITIREQWIDVKISFIHRRKVINRIIDNKNNKYKRKLYM